MSADFLSNEEIVLAARKNLSQFAWDYLVGGAESETTLRRNRLALDRLAFRPRVLANVSNIDTSMTFLGGRLRIPVILGPIGSMQHLSPDGAIGFAKAAVQYGTVMSMAQMTPPSLEEVAAATDAPKLFQMYVQGDIEWARQLLARVRDAGYAALCLTADSPYHGRHDRQILYPGPRGRRAPAHRDGPNYLASVTWETLDRIRELWHGPFILKGVQTAEDATLAVKHGVDMVWVSNHGGRQMDSALGAIDVLPEVVQAVGGRAQIIFDSGVQRGSDVLKALALGADVVAIGKLQGWGMAAAGVDGVVRVLELLENEMVSAMGLIGVTCIDQLNATYLTRAEPVTPPHEVSAWVNMPGGRLQ
ncbi:MAG TPA: alpha-hydroxy acid oxidase [Dehalococcoidia bacterium]|nr:alpha-hydroxy acid oxidase [Dehalococcoidia bacterium]